MNKNKIILASSFVLLSAILVYTNFQEDEQAVAVIKAPEPVKIISKVQTPKIIQTTQKDKLATEEKAPAPSTTKKKQEIFQTKYKLSILPENMDVKEKKQRFNELLIPAVSDVYADLEKQYHEAKSLLKDGNDSEKIKSLMKTYNAADSQDLLKRLKPHPKSIAIAQAAIQSGWATSRFTLRANNIFGVWSFDENEPRVQASEDEAIYVKKYASLNESVRDYYKLLATSPLFEEFREEKMKTNDPYTLIKSLDKYYKEGDDYATGLNELIKYNELEKYDN